MLFRSRSLAELEAAFAEWGASAGQLVRDAEVFAGELAVPGAHNRANAGTALAALELAGIPAAEAIPALGTFTGTGRRFEVSEAGGVTIVDDYGHHPTEVAAAIAAAREAFPGRRVRVLFQPHLFSRTRHLATEFGAALAQADDVAVTEIYAAREQPIPGVSGMSVVRAVSDAGKLAAFVPTVDDGVTYLLSRARTGDVLLIAGAGDIDRAPALLRERLAGR